MPSCDIYQRFVYVSFCLSKHQYNKELETTQGGDEGCCRCWHMEIDDHISHERHNNKTPFLSVPIMASALMYTLIVFQPKAYMTFREK